MHTEQAEIFSIIRNIVIISSVFLGVIIFYVIYLFGRQQRKMALWQEARIKAEIETLENERKRIAGDLHDDIGPMLSSIKLHINHIDPPGEEERKIIDRSSIMIDEVIQHFREIAYNLLPNILIRKGLLTAITEFAERMNDTQALRIEFTHEGDIPLSSSNELNLYRIVQEIVHNAIRHSEASRLTITIQKQKQQIVFTAEDNGKGFQYGGDTLQHTSGLGLMNIQNRVILCNGKLSIKSEHNKGTSYLILLPLDHQ